MSRRTLVRDNVGRLSADNRTDNHPPLGGVVRCLVRRPSRKQIREVRAALGVLLHGGTERLPFDDPEDMNQPGVVECSYATLAVTAARRRATFRSE